MITPPRSGGSGLTGKSGRKTANVCDASTKEMKINTAANFVLVAFSKINRLSSFSYEIFRLKFSEIRNRDGFAARARWARGLFSRDFVRELRSVGSVERGEKCTTKRTKSDDNPQRD